MSRNQSAKGCYQREANYATASAASVFDPTCTVSGLRASLLHLLPPGTLCRTIAAASKCQCLVAVPKSVCNQCHQQEPSRRERTSKCRPGASRKCSSACFERATHQTNLNLRQIVEWFSRSYPPKQHPRIMTALVGTQ